MPQQCGLTASGPAQVIHKVVIEHKQPEMLYYIPAQLVQLAEDCWQHSADARPSFAQLVARLEALSGSVEELLVVVQHAEQGAVTDF